MRVLISGLWAAEAPSGICRTVVNLIRCLNLADPALHVTLAVGAWQRKYFYESLGLGELQVEVIEVAIANRPISRNAWYAHELPRLARRVSADLVHLSFPAPVTRRAFPCPILTTVHDLYPYDSPQNFGYPRVLFNRWFLRRSLQQSDRIICVSEFTLGQLRCHFGERFAKKAVCIQNPIRLSAVHPCLERVFAQPYLLVVAQHRANKNLNLVLDSFCVAKQRDVLSPETLLVIVGSEGPETPHLKQRAESLAVTNDVVFLSGLEDEKLATLYRDCSLFLALSDIEGFGLPLAEALLFGARVVASDIAAHREIGGDQLEYVRLHQPDAVHAVVKAVQVALHGVRPCAEVVAHLSPGVAGFSYVAEYRRTLGAIPQAARVSRTEAATT